MWPVSSRYLATLARSHVQLSVIEIIKNGTTVATLQGGTIIDRSTGAPLNSIGGSVSVSSSTIRRSCSLQLLDPLGQLSPLQPTALLAPYVTDVRVWVGVRYWDAVPVDNSIRATSWTIGTDLLSDPDVELVPVGTFVITEPELNDKQINLQGYDRGWLLANFPYPYTVVGGTLVTDAINGILSFMIPNNRFAANLPGSSATVSSAVTFDADTSSGDAVQQLARSAGMVFTADPMGTFVMYVPPSTSDNPVLTLTPGPGSVMYRPQRQLGGADVFNTVVYTNEGSSNTTILRGIAMDTNPNSLTSTDLIGIRPTFMSSPLLSTQAQVDQAARTHLLNILGLSDQITIVMLPNHALDADDVLQVTDPATGINQLNVIADSFDVPLRASDGVMTVQSRANVDLNTST